VQLPFFNLQLADTDWQPETSWPSASRIEVEDAVAHLHERLVGVPADNAGESGSPRIEIELAQVVNDVNGNFADSDHFGLRQMMRPSVAIDIAADGVHGSDPAQFVENRRIPDIAGMNNQAAATQGRDRIRAQQSVGVGDNSKDHRRRSAGPGNQAAPAQSRSSYLFFKGTKRLMGFGTIALLLFLFVASAHILGYLFTRLRQPRVVGEILAGVLLGPVVLGQIAPGWTAAFTHVEAKAVLEFVYNLGLVLLMFASGAETHGLFGKHDRRQVGILGLVGTGVPFIIGLTVASCISMP
jgi:hypothetical protein